MDETTANLENKGFNPFPNQGNNLFFSKINAQYYSVMNYNKISDNSFSILHVNIRSMSNSFEKLKLIITLLKHGFH